jgi:3alpha(or 20beta)-hydroxysteroid dehydrogenase
LALTDEPVAIVTGAAAGQGAEHARRLAADGFRVVATDVADPTDDGAVGGCRKLDVAEERQWTELVGAVLDEFGRIDVLVNNAGIAGPSAPIDETPLAVYQQVIAVNQIGCFLGLRAVIPAMRRARSGSIINISSVAGMGGAPGRIAYQASKWAIRGMTRSAAVELAEYGVRVNAIVPGWVDTQMAANAVVPVEQLAAGIPFGRIAAPPQSRYITGTDVVIDGGIRARI